MSVHKAKKICHKSQSHSVQSIKQKNSNIIEEVSGEADNTKYDCSLCFKSFHTERGLKSHLESHKVSEEIMCGSMDNNMDQAVASHLSGDTDSNSETLAIDLSSTTSLEEICLTSLNSNSNSVSCNSGDPSSCFETLVAVSTSVDDSSYQPSLNITNLEAPTFAQVDISYALPAVIDNF